MFQAWGDSHIKSTGGGVLIENFEKPLEKFQYLFLWAWLGIVSPLGGTNSKTIRIRIIILRTLFNEGEAH